MTRSYHLVMQCDTFHFISFHLIISTDYGPMCRHSSNLPIPQKLFHRLPGRIEPPHESNHAFEDVPNGIRRHLERTDLGDVLAFDLADLALGFIDHRLDAEELFFHISFAGLWRW